MSMPPPSTPDRSRIPEPGSVRPFSFPEVLSSTLPSGLGLRIARTGNLPLATAMMVLDAGEGVLPDPQAGLAVLAGQSLEGGTRRRSGPQLIEALERIGTSLVVHTGWDSTAVSLTCLAERLPEAMELLAEALLEPAFPPDEVERFREQRLAAIRQRRMDPGSLADDASSHFIFADEVPYHRPLAGTPESVGELGADTIRSFAEGRYVPGGSGLVVVGDVDADEVFRLAERHLGSWTGSIRPEAQAEVRPRYRERRVLIVDRPDSVQSELRIGQVGVPRTTPRYFEVQVFNTVLGGAFTSRLMLNLRERQGFTYGIRSRFGFRRAAGPFRISTAVATEVTAPAVREAILELETLLVDGPTPDEVSRARDFIAGVFPLQLETTGQVAGRIGELLVYGLPDDYFSTYRDRIRAVTAEGAAEAGREVLDPRSLVVTVVGDAAGVRGPLEDLGLGPVEVTSFF